MEFNKLKKLHPDTLLWLILAGLAWLPFSCHALSTDHLQQMVIKADQAHLDEQKGIVTYKGNVVVTQGSIRITADTLRTHFTPERTLIRLISIGKPATFQQRPDNQQEDVKGQADKIIYTGKNKILLLINNAQLVQGGHSVESDRIIYNLEKDTFSAGKSDSDEPVTIIIPGQPESGSK